MPLRWVVPHESGLDSNSHPVQHLLISLGDLPGRALRSSAKPNQWTRHPRRRRLSKKSKSASTIITISIMIPTTMVIIMILISKITITMGTIIIRILRSRLSQCTISILVKATVTISSKPTGASKGVSTGSFQRRF